MEYAYILYKYMYIYIYVYFMYIKYLYVYKYRLPWMAQMVKNLPTMQETRVLFLGWTIPWQRAWQPTPVFLPGESPWTEEPGRLQSTGSQSWTLLKRLSMHGKIYLKISFSQTRLTKLCLYNLITPNKLYSINHKFLFSRVKFVKISFILRVEADFIK